MVVDTPIGKIGLAICWDLAFPELFRSMIKQGAEIICILSYWSTGGNKPADAEIKASKMMIATLCLARALENECLIIYALNENIPLFETACYNFSRFYTERGGGVANESSVKI